MQNGVCPKCQSNDIFVKRDASEETLAAGAFRPAVLTTYICGNCGYVEQYVLDHMALAVIRHNWQRADEQHDFQHKRKNDGTE